MPERCVVVTRVRTKHRLDAIIYNYDVSQSRDRVWLCAFLRLCIIQAIAVRRSTATINFVLKQSYRPLSVSFSYGARTRSARTDTILFHVTVAHRCVHYTTRINHHNVINGTGRDHRVCRNAKPDKSFEIIFENYFVYSGSTRTTERVDSYRLESFWVYNRFRTHV